MKIFKSKEKQFEPITIILETEEEAVVLKSLLGIIGGKGSKRNIALKMYDSLYEAGVPKNTLLYDVPYRERVTSIYFDGES